MEDLVDIIRRGRISNEIVSELNPDMGREEARKVNNYKEGVYMSVGSNKEILRLKMGYEQIKRLI